MAKKQNWNAIRRAFERGAPWKELEALGVNKGTISKRAKREDWDTSKRRGARPKKKAKKAKAKKKPARKKKNSSRATPAKKKGNKGRKSSAKVPPPPVPVDDGGQQREARAVCKQILLMARNGLAVAEKMVEQANGILDDKKSNPSRLRAAGSMLEKGTRSLHTASDVIIKIQGVMEKGNSGNSGAAPRVTAEQWVNGHEDLPP